MNDIVATYTIYENQSKLMNLGYDLEGYDIHQQDLHSARAQGHMTVPIMSSHGLHGRKSEPINDMRIFMSDRCQRVSMNLTLFPLRTVLTHFNWVMVRHI